MSNYTVKHLEELLQYATIKPDVLQVVDKLQRKLDIEVMLLGML